MDIEVNIENLRSLCRLCLHEGEINLWHHNVIQENDETTDDDQVSVHTIFEIFKDDITTNLPLSNEMPLLCTSCLEELLQCQRFYQKLQLANAQICQLYEEAEQHFESDDPSASCDVDCEITTDLFKTYNETTNDQSENIDENIYDEFEVKESSNSSVEFVTHTQTDNLLSLDENTSHKDHDHQESSSSSPNTDKSIFAVKRNGKCNNNKVTTTSAGKRLRRGREKADKPLSPLQQDAALIITRFIPATYAETDNHAKTQAFKSRSSDSTEVRIMNYSTVEVQANKIHLINENPSVLEQEENTRGGTTNNVPVYQCQYCPQAFTLPQYLVTHATKSHVCKFCTETFAKTTDLYKHIREMHPNHRCVICSKELSSASNLRSHIRRLHGLQLPSRVALIAYKPSSSSHADDNVSKLDTKDNDNQSSDNDLESNDAFVDDTITYDSE